MRNVNSFIKDLNSGHHVHFLLQEPLRYDHLYILVSYITRKRVPFFLYVSLSIKTVSLGDACGVMVIVVGNGHGDSSSNPGWEWLHFT